MIESYAVNANGTVANVQANLSELDGVLDCVVLENYTNQPQQQYGITLTAHSMRYASWAATTRPSPRRSSSARAPDAGRSERRR